MEIGKGIAIVLWLIFIFIVPILGILTAGDKRKKK